VFKFKYIVFFLLLFNSTFICAQPEYKVKGRIFTSIKKAMLEPDSVERLKLKRKGYKEIPSEIFNFKNLKELDLGGNKIKNIDPKIGLLSKLEILKLNRNQIVLIPTSISKLDSLKYLDVGLNKINALPEEMKTMRSLEFLQIWGNELTVIPEPISKMPNLKWLDMRAIILTETEKEDIQNDFPQVKVLFSPGCNCGK